MTEADTCAMTLLSACPGDTILCFSQFDIGTSQILAKREFQWSRLC
jgi:hypothetical protein